MERMTERKEILHGRIEAERKDFFRKVLTLSPEEIVGNAYKLDCINHLCQILHEIIDDASKSQLKTMLSREQILEWFYQNWLKENDDFYKEMKESMVRILQREMTICGRTEDVKNG